MGAGHDHHHHHGVADQRRLRIALALILGLMAVEVVAGILAHSLALLSDAAHMLTDAAALWLAIVAVRLAARPPRGALTYGLKRAEPLAAMVNGIVLGLLGLAIAAESVRRLIDPPDVEAGFVLVVALLGALVNLGATLVLSGGEEQRSINVEGAFQHIVTDLYAFMATAVAAAIILATGENRADPAAALLVAALMLRACYQLVRASGRVVLEAAPEGMDVEKIGMTLAARPNVVQVHDLHIWELTTGFPALSAHVVVPPDVDCHGERRELEELLRERFGIAHSTLQVEHDEGQQLLEIE